MKRTALVLLTIVLLVPNFIPVDINTVLAYDGKEAFDPSLSRINSIQKLTDYIDLEAEKQGIKSGTLDYAVLTETVIKKRFYHGFSHYTLQQNWIAALAEKFIGYGLGSIVKPDDIITYPNAACSQQSIVMVEVLHSKQYDYRSVGFPHHFALEFGVGYQWYYFDPNMEPKISQSDRAQQVWNGDPKRLCSYYDKNRFNDLDWKLGSNQVTYGKVNEPIAADATIFHSMTGFLSKTFWLMPLLMLLYPLRKTMGRRLFKILFYTPPDNVRDIISIELR